MLCVSRLDETAGTLADSAHAEELGTFENKSGDKSPQSKDVLSSSRMWTAALFGSFCFSYPEDAVMLDCAKSCALKWRRQR